MEGPKYLAKFARRHKDPRHHPGVRPLAAPALVARNEPWARRVDHEGKSCGVVVVNVTIEP
eukprot:1949185-Lingulodinium_polyedra.AAC.1